MKIRTDKSIKIIVKYIIIFVCVAFGSLIYASNAGLSRKLILVLLIPVCCLYYICDKHMSEKWNRYVLFTLFYWIIVGPLIKDIFDNERIAAAGSDAVVQMYQAMLYIGRTIREGVNAFLTGEKFKFPMWEWSLGMGENSISTLNYYGFGDPFYLLAAFISEEKLTCFFTIFYYARMYAGGLACIAFFNELDSGKSTAAYVIGALVYSFSGFSYYSNVFIIFVHAMMYTPMML